MNNIIPGIKKFTIAVAIQTFISLMGVYVLCVYVRVRSWVGVYMYCQQWQRGMRQQMEKPLKYSWKSLENSTFWSATSTWIFFIFTLYFDEYFFYFVCVIESIVFFPSEFVDYFRDSLGRSRWTYFLTWTWDAR